MKTVVAAFNQEKALVGAFSVIVQPVVEPMDRFAALVISHASSHLACMCGAGAATMGWNTCSGSLVAPPRPRLLSVSLEEEE